MLPWLAGVVRHRYPGLRLRSQAHFALPWARQTVGPSVRQSVDDFPKKSQPLRSVGALRVHREPNGREASGFVLTKTECT